MKVSDTQTIQHFVEFVLESRSPELSLACARSYVMDHPSDSVRLWIYLYNLASDIECDATFEEIYDKLCSEDQEYVDNFAMQIVEFQLMVVEDLNNFEGN